MVDETASVVASSEKTERTITVQGIATHVFEAGPPAAPPLLYLHGTNLGNLWLDYHTALSQNFHVFAPDTPGFGLTERPDWMRDMSDYILFFRDLLDELGLAQPRVVGHSLGGWMAAEMAVWYPERIKKLVLANAAGIRVKGTPIGDLFAMNPQEVISACFDDFAAAMPLMPPEVNVDYLFTQYRQFTTLASLAWNPNYDPKLARRLAYVKTPTLVIWGRNDRLIPVAYADAFHHLITNSEQVILAGTGHMPMFEKTQEWCKIISDFLNKEM
ncbi:MAG: alpha/beta hydrolase [Ktedonobacteraceae bacterium]